MWLYLHEVTSDREERLREGASMSEKLDLKLKIWRQAQNQSDGHFEEYTVVGISEDASFLEMLDVLNDDLVQKGEEPIVFDHDCREGICGSCSMTINGNPHGPDRGTATCQLHMRRFSHGETITVEPFRAAAFPVIRDLCVDRSSLDRIIESGGYVSVNTGSAQDANSLPVNKDAADRAFESATCIGCGACVAACVNSSAMLFLSAKVSHLAYLPQGQVEREQRVLNMMDTMEKSGFGHCSNTGACSLSCPKEIDFSTIVKTNREYTKAALKATK